MIDKSAPRIRPLQNSSPQGTSTQEQKLREVAALYEKHFLGEMVKAMRSTVPSGGFIKTNQAEQIFRDKLDQEYVENWGNKGGIGLQDLIYNQLIEKYGVQLGIRFPDSKPQGPLPLNKNHIFQSQVAKAPKNGKLQIQFDKRPESTENPISPPLRSELIGITSPWAGKVINKIAVDEFTNVIELDHEFAFENEDSLNFENHLQSQFIYHGPPSLLSKNSIVQAGQEVATLSPDAQRFFWNLSNPESK